MACCGGAEVVCRSSMVLATTMPAAHACSPRIADASFDDDRTASHQGSAAQMSSAPGRCKAADASSAPRGPAYAPPR